MTSISKVSSRGGREREREWEREREREREVGGGGGGGGEGGREKEMWSLREAILFVGVLRKRGEKNRGKREKECDMLQM